MAKSTTPVEDTLHYNAKYVLDRMIADNGSQKIDVDGVEYTVIAVTRFGKDVVLTVWNCNRFKYETIEATSARWAYKEIKFI